MKKITVTLTDKAEKYLNELLYSIDKGDGKVATLSEAVNYVFETLSCIEEIVGDPLTFICEYPDDKV